MRLKFIFFFLLMAFCSASFAQTYYRSIYSEGIKRSFVIHVPEKTVESGLPLVIVLHGHGGTGKQIMKSTGFNDISDREKFIAVYPDGIKKNWNDGREKKDDTKYDDVGFISALIDTISGEFKIDTARIFVTGMSNGGFMSIYLAFKLNYRILGVAPICANIPERISPFYEFSKPLSVMLINGTDDPLVRYEGGKVGFGILKNRGYALSTDESVNIFVRENKCSAVPVHAEIQDKNIDDECFAERYTFTGGENNTEVVLIKVVNGGHTIPGGIKNLPKTLVGNTCEDFNAPEMIWSFFKSRTCRK